MDTGCKFVLKIQNLKEITQFLSRFYPKTASRVLRELQKKITQLSNMPDRYEVYLFNTFYHKKIVDQF